MHSALDSDLGFLLALEETCAKSKPEFQFHNESFKKIQFVVKDEKSNKEILHPRVLGQHPLRLPPDYLPERSYNEIFNAIEKLEGQIWEEMEVSYQPEVLPVQIIFFYRLRNRLKSKN